MQTTVLHEIALVGAGNVAVHLGKALAAAGHTITAVYARTPASREELAAQLPPAVPAASPDLRNTGVTVVILAVPDAVLAQVAAELQVTDGTLVVHTSGSQPLASLEGAAGARTGVFYPLQTFSKIKPVDFSNIPVLVEAAEEQTLQELEQLARSISLKVQVVSSDARKQLHLAAVFACNFTNHLLGISREILEQANLPADLLQPLISETITKASQYHPFTVQTGPAVRRDQNVLEEHLRLLQHQPVYQHLYQALSESIVGVRELESLGVRKLES